MFHSCLLYSDCKTKTFPGCSTQMYFIFVSFHGVEGRTGSHCLSSRFSGRSKANSFPNLVIHFLAGTSRLARMCQARHRLLEVTDFPRRLSISAATVEVLKLVHEMKTVSTSSLEPTFMSFTCPTYGVTRPTFL